MRAWDNYYCRGFGPDPDQARERLGSLRFEQEKSMMFGHSDEDEPLFYTKTFHPLDFKCQCAKCVRLHTITMQDRDFLCSIGILWQIARKRL
jgi:hypothetical protein